ncbi:MAG: hypothetical protein A3H70_04035 [Candidatus Komeilibacteria bacterium RIFCSPLOWO2_02_FULL_48_11]|uniref:Peptidase M16 n=1 Tax=Candidatus Komeilibacteria bacterium RIFCSPLOWO2_02_FULL_48_11 TaxID=1798553 RepID=A0A1G2BQL8_9BACT|nr:MAG: hypothetical protein A3H70_04035 [Candidatus Komeilibacteria bacterium RIFCSPLOWO2_02_FULL_48_11]
MFTQHRLSNSIRIILAPHDETRAVSLLVLIRVGSRSEEPGQSGVSHFLEHLMFKGTARRPSTLVISQELDSVGAEYNAFTAKDQTGYYIKSASANLELAADMLSDMLSNSLFVAEEVERERGTILEEINMYEDNPMAKVENFFDEDFFGPGTPLGRYVIGVPRTVRAITREQIVNYWRQHYVGENIVISLSGNFKPERALAMLARKFGSLPAGRFNSVKKARLLPRRPQLAAHYKKTNQGHMVLGFSGVPYNHKDREALGLLAIILGGNMSSRLFISVRERLGLCYFIRAQAESYEDTGTFSIQAGLDLGKVGQALKAIAIELKSVKQGGVNKEELAKAKQYIKGKTDLSLEESLDVASFYGKQVLFHRQVLTPEQALKRVMAVTKSDIARLAKKALDKRQLNLVMLSPFKSLNRFAKFLDI